MPVPVTLRNLLLSRVARLAASSLVLGSSAAAAAAAPPLAPPAAATPAEGSYPGTLTVAYVAAPLLALAIGGALSEVEASDEVAVALAGTMFLAPMGVHLYHRADERAALSLLSMIGLTLGGTLVGAGAGYLENQLSCDPAQDSECQDRGIGTTIAGAVIGSMVGYVASAVLDVSLRSSAPETDLSAATAQIWIAPARSATRSAELAVTGRGAGRAPLGDGILIGVTLRL
jgi:hypothetical protein